MQWFQIFSDETRRGLIPKYHKPSVHFIGSISRRGPIPLIVFEGHMSLCNQFLVSFITTFPNGHNLPKDNAPFNTSPNTSNYLRYNGINHWETPAQSLDMNPI